MRKAPQRSNPTKTTPNIYGNSYQFVHIHNNFKKPLNNLKDYQYLIV
jgi:hypothetical protein